MNQFEAFCQKYGIVIVKDGLQFGADLYVATHPTAMADEVLTTIENDVKAQLPAIAQGYADVVFKALAPDLTPIVASAIAQFGSPGESTQDQSVIEGEVAPA